jgi:hypothetical protein
MGCEYRTNFFLQQMDFLPAYEFRKCVSRYPAITRYKTFPAETSFSRWLSRN